MPDGEPPGGRPLSFLDIRDAWLRQNICKVADHDQGRVCVPERREAQGTFGPFALVRREAHGTIVQGRVYVLVYRKAQETLAPRLKPMRTNQSPATLQWQPVRAQTKYQKRRERRAFPSTGKPSSKLGNKRK